MDAAGIADDMVIMMPGDPSPDPRVTGTEDLLVNGGIEIVHAGELRRHAPVDCLPWASHAFVRAKARPSLPSALIADSILQRSASLRVLLG